MSQRLDAALALARLGFRIFPLEAGTKTPVRGLGWKAIMTTNEERIRSWFNEYPDMNYAVVCDEHHVILDPDEGKDKRGNDKRGIQNFLDIEQEDGGWPSESILDHTLRVRTPKGGVHLYFSCDAAYRNSAGTIIPSVDVRGPDGYVVGPGCYTFDDPAHNTVEGEYTVESDCEIAPIPEWLKKRLDEGGTVTERAESASVPVAPVDHPALIEQAKAKLRERKPGIEGDHGDEHTYVTACVLKDIGVSKETALDLMYGLVLFPADEHHSEGRTWNEMCEPEWTYEELKTKVRNAYRYGSKPPGVKADVLAIVGNPTAPTGEAPDPMMAGQQQISAIDQPIGEDEDAKRIAALLFTPADFASRTVDMDALVPDMVPAFGVTALLGTRSIGKSVTLQDFCFRVVTDSDWLGMPIAPGWAAVYLCGEDDVGLQRQLRAWQKFHNIVIPEDRLIIAPAVPNLMDARQVKLWAVELYKKFHGRRVLVIFDTWQRATSTASQNDDKEMQQAMHHAEALARSLDGCAMIAFHPPKGREDTITGSMVLENSTTSILLMTEAAGFKHLEVTRIKGAAEGTFLDYKFQGVPLGEKDKFGRDVTGVIPMFSGGTGFQKSEAQVKFEEELRARIAHLLIDVLSDKPKGISLKEAACEIVRECGRNPTEMLGDAFHHPRTPEPVMSMVEKLWSNNAHVILDNMGSVHYEGGKFVMRGNPVP